MTPSRPSVLLVDDVPANLVALEAQLSKLDCELVQATSGNEALALLLKHPFAVMLLDVQMPEMDGYEVATLARDNPATRNVPIIFVTAMHETEENALRGYGTGAVDFLFKPINPVILRSKVQVFLDLYLGQRKLAAEVEAHRETLGELESFNYSVSHDLRAPLRPLDGFSQAILEDCGDRLDDRSKEYLRRIRAAAQRMGQLIEDMLQLSRMSQAQMALRKVDLVPIAAAVIDELRTQEPGREVEYVSVPSAVVDGDGRLLRIVFENLLRNAWKFTKKVAKPRIELGVRSDEGRTRYFVRDNGAGFDPGSAERLFQPFQRFHKASDFEGTGIGLAIVRRIVKRHGGDIQAESAPGQGATFLFTLHDEIETP
jgi:signal transduction histidine kinase